MSYGYVLDIETDVIPDVEGYLVGARAPSNYKDKDKIAAYVEEAKAEERKKASLDPDLCRIVAAAIKPIGTAAEVETDGMIAQDEIGERDILEWLWRMFRDPVTGPATLVGYNILDFDLPVLMRRSLYLDVPFIKYGVSRFRHDRVIDLMQILSMDGKLKYRSKDWYCKRFNIHEDDRLTGAGVAQAIAEGKYSLVLDHCIADVRKEYRLALAIDAISA